MKLTQIFLLACLATVINAAMAASTQAQTADNPVVHVKKHSKSKKPGGADQAVATKKSAPTSDEGSCAENDKKWHDGEHCTFKCDDKEAVCDMHICLKGTWKPYSSCFGKHAAAPNCPAFCGG
jgi:hypothetical protein